MLEVSTCRKRAKTNVPDLFAEFIFFRLISGAGAFMMLAAVPVRALVESQSTALTIA